MTNLPHPVASRRDFLRASAAAALSLPLLGNDGLPSVVAPWSPRRGAPKTRHVVLVAFAARQLGLHATQLDQRLDEKVKSLEATDPQKAQALRQDKIQ